MPSRVRWRGFGVYVYQFVKLGITEERQSDGHRRTVRYAFQFFQRFCYNRPTFVRTRDHIVESAAMIVVKKIADAGCIGVGITAQNCRTVLGVFKSSPSDLSYGLCLLHYALGTVIERLSPLGEKLSKSMARKDWHNSRVSL